MVFRRKNLQPMARFYQEKKFGGPMIDTISQKLQILKQWIDTIRSQHGR
jgi:hypothetical protein